MPDLFGQNITDYKHLARIKKAGLLDSHNSQLKARGRVHDFNALPTLSAPIAMPMQDVEANAQALQIVTNNFQAIQAQIEEILYGDFRLDEWFPLVTNIPEGARSYSYRVVNKYGAGKFIDNSGKSANSATVSLQNVPYSLEYGGIIPSWTLEDLRNAAYAGIALDNETIKAGTEGCMNHIEDIGIVGDTARGFTGLINNASVTINAVSETITSMTADENVAWVQSIVSAMIADTQEIFGRNIKTGMTLYLPVAQAGRLLTLKLATDASKSVWDYVKTANLWTHMTGQELKMAIVAELKDAAANGTDDRGILTFNHERVMEMAMPIQPRSTGVIQVAFGVEAPMEYKISGLNVKRPAAMAYYDAV